ncbi:MAG: WD40 repeat domain-containing protein [Candidatus Helarchaeota archaeon]
MSLKNLFEYDFSHLGNIISQTVLSNGKYVVNSTNNQLLIIWDLETGKILRTIKSRKRYGKLICVPSNGRQVIGYTKTYKFGVEKEIFDVWDINSGELLQSIKIKPSKEWRVGKTTNIITTSDGKYLISNIGGRVTNIWDIENGYSLLKKIEYDKGYIGSITITLDGKYLIGSDFFNPIINIWDFNTGNLLRTLDLNNTIDNIIIHPNKQNLICTFANKIQIRDFKTGKLLQIFKGHQNNIISIAITPDGSRLISWSNYSIRIWDFKTSNLLQTIHQLFLEISLINLTPDGRRLIISDVSGKKIKIYDLSKELRFRGIKKNSVIINMGIILSLLALPNGKYVVGGLHNGNIVILDIEKGKTSQIFRGHKGIVHSIAISPDGKYLVSGSIDGTIRIWNIETGELLRTLDKHKDEVRSVAITPDGKKIFSASKDETIMIWDLQTGRLLDYILEIGPMISIVITPDGKHIIGTVERISFGIDGRMNELIGMWDLKTFKRLQGFNEFNGHSNVVNSIAISPDGKYLISGSFDNTIIIWNIKNRSILRKLEGHKDAVISVSITPDGKQVVSGSKDKTVRIWDLETGSLLQILEGHNDLVCSVATTADGKKIISNSFDGTIRIWDLNKDYLISEK